MASKGQAVVYVDITWVEELERAGLYAEVERVLIEARRPLLVGSPYLLGA